MIKEGLFVGGVLIQRRVKKYILVEYKFDVETPYAGSFQHKVVTKEQLIAGMSKGIKIDNVGFENLATKNNIKGIHGGLNELEVVVDGNVFGVAEYRYCLGTVDGDDKKALLVCICCSGIGTAKIEVNVFTRKQDEFDSRNSPWYAKKPNIIKRVNYLYDSSSKRFIGKNFTLENIDTNVINTSDDIIFNVIKGQLKQVKVMGVGNDDADKIITEAIKARLTTTRAEQKVLDAVEKFRRGNTDSLVIKDLEDILDNTLYKGRTDIDEKIGVISLMAMHPADVGEIGFMRGVSDSSLNGVWGKSLTWNNIAAIGCDKGVLLVDMYSKRVMKAVALPVHPDCSDFRDGVTCISKFVVDLAYKVGTYMNKNSSCVETICNGNREVYSGQMFNEYRKLTSLVGEVLNMISQYGTLNTHFSVNSDGDKIVAIINNNKKAGESAVKYNHVCVELMNTDYSLPGVQYRVVKKLEYNVAPTIELAKRLKDRAVSIKALADGRKCGLFTNGEADIMGVIREGMHRYGTTKAAVYRATSDDAKGKLMISIENFSGPAPYNSIVKDIEISGGCSNKELMGKMSLNDSTRQVLAACVTGGCGIGAVMTGHGSISGITSHMLKVAHEINKSNKYSLFGYSNVVAKRTLMAEIEDVVRKYGDSGDEAYPSIGIACALAGVIIETGDNDLFIGNRITNSLMIPLYTRNGIAGRGIYDLSARKTDYYEHTNTLKAVMDAVANKRNEIEFKCESYTELVEATLIDLRVG